MICLICNREFKSIVAHLTKFHKISYQEYYLNYLKGEIKYCKECGQPALFVKTSYKDYCSKKCLYILSAKKMKRTNLERYGTSCSLNTKESIEKKKLTWIENYGVDNPSCCEFIKQQKKDTCLEHYGVDSILKLKEVRQKANPWSEKARLKRKETTIRKYGIDHHLKNKKVLEKQQITNLEKYGNVCSLYGSEVRKKVKNTWIQKYGEDNPSKNKNIINKLSKISFNRENIKRKKFIPIVRKVLEDNGLILLSEYNHSHKTITVKCKICGNVYESSYNIMHKCSVCYPSSTSIAEKSLYNFILSLGFKIESNNRKEIKPYEIDIYIPKKKIGIEYNGLYWHSEVIRKDKNYHLNKLNKCLEKGINLIQIFEDEWLFKQDLVKSRLRQILGVNSNFYNSECNSYECNSYKCNSYKRIHARLCNIKEIDSKIKNKFLDTYHIQGEDNSFIKLGAFFNEKLVSVMTFSKGNIAKGSFSKEGVWELNRFCSKSNYHIPGIASKLLSFFKKNYYWKEIFSYADRRWSVGNLYYRLGFSLEKITRPNYWYVKNGFRFHRFGLRKKPEEPKNIPEWLLRLEEGYARIWDCGHLKFIYLKKKGN